MSEFQSSQSPKRKHNGLNGLDFQNSKVMPPTLKPSAQLDLHRDDSLTSQLSTEKYQFKPQLISQYMVSEPYRFQLNPNRYKDPYISSASKEIAPYDYWTANNQKPSHCI